MAAAAVLQRADVAGLHRQPTAEEMATSLEVYNTLPADSQQPEVAALHLTRLGELFVRHGAQDSFGVHLLHGHFPAPNGTAVVGMDFEATPRTRFCWIRPRPWADMPKPRNASLKGHKYRLDGSTFVPYEFREEEPGSDSDAQGAASVPAAFYSELAAYLLENQLEDIVGLEILDRVPQDQNSVEFVLGPGLGTVMLEREDVNMAGSGACRVVSWTFKDRGHGAVECQEGTLHAELTRDNSPVFGGGRILPDTAALLAALREASIVV